MVVLCTPASLHRCASGAISTLVNRSCIQCKIREARKHARVLESWDRRYAMKRLFGGALARAAMLWGSATTYGKPLGRKVRIR